MYKNNSRCVKDLNVEGKSMELLEGNKEEYLYQIRGGTDFLNKTQKTLP